jgi:hypothetical protein
MKIRNSFEKRHTRRGVPFFLRNFLFFLLPVGFEGTFLITVPLPAIESIKGGSMKKKKRNGKGMDQLWP